MSAIVQSSISVSTDRRGAAEQILHSLRSDVELIPANLAGWWTEYLMTQHRRFLETLSLLDTDDEKGEVLEIGCVPGHLTVLLKRLGYNVRGVDIAPGRAERLWGKYSIPVDKVDVERDSLPFPSDSFSTVFFVEILEHLTANPLHALAEAHRVLKPNGRIILSTPHISPYDRFLFLFGVSYHFDPIEEFEKLEWLGSRGNIRFYDSREVTAFLEHAGFRVCSHTKMIERHMTWKERTAVLLLRMATFRKRDDFCRYLFVTARKK